MPDRPLPGRSLVSRRAVVDIVRSAVVTSYGVIGVDAGRLERLLGRLGVGEPGIRVRLDRGIEVDLRLAVGYGLPIAEVARQVDSAVRYAIHRSLDHEVHRLTVHVAGLRYQPASVPPPREVPRESSPAEAVTAPTGGPSSGAGPDAAEASDASAGTTAIVAPPAISDDQDGRGKPRRRRRRASAGHPGDP